eukprot:GHUV01030087.1.p1 GENE.GHUV01030087.1~~GHUV01030087.1.p1  ORF type:complete len:989 (+),score=366.66 GHUV01030087.1:1269-4235(+)
MHCRYLCLVSRRVVDASLSPEERRQYQDAELGPLGQLVTDAAAAYYAAAAERLRQKQLDLAAALGSSPPEVNAAIAFKLAVLAEFRQDWLAAVSSYQAAAAALQGVPLGRPTVSCQRHAEVTAVAEIVHFKAMMLLLHQQRYAEVVQQLRGHLATFGPTPDGLPLAAVAAHHGWLARQYQAAAEMVAMSRMDQATLQAHKDVSPCYLLMSAAQIAVTRKALADQLHHLRGYGPPPLDVSSVRKGRYLGQVEFKKVDGTAVGHSDMTDAQFALYLEAEERRINHNQQVLDLLLQAQTMHLKQTGQSAAPPIAAGTAVGRSVKAAADRLQARLTWLIAEQHVDTHNLTAARKLLLQTVYTYRRDGWDALLLQSLLLLRDVCQRLKLHQEALLHSLELACVADSLPSSANSNSQPAATLHELADHEQAIGLAAAALASMLTGPGDKKGSIMKTSSNVSPGDRVTAAADEAQQRHANSPTPSAWHYTVQQLDLSAALQQAPAQEDGGRATNVADVLQQYHQQEFGWWRILTIAGGFMAHAPDPAQLQVCVAVYNQLPIPIPLTGATVTLVDSKGSWVQELLLGPGPQQQAAVAEQQQSAAAGQSSSAAGLSAADCAAAANGIHAMHISDSTHTATAWPAQLQPGSWLVAHALVTPRTAGSVGVDQLLLQLSDLCSVSFLLSSFPPGRPALGRLSLPGGQEPFKVQQGVKQGVWVTKVQHVGRLPNLQVVMPQSMLVAEFCLVEVRVHAFAAQSAASLELSLRSPTGAVPGQVTMLAALPDGKLHALSTEGHAMQLPELAAGSSFSQRLWVRSTLASSCRLVAVLSCPAQVHQSADLHFVEPFEHVTRLAGELGVHTLVAPAQSFANSSGPAASDSAGAVALAVGQVIFAQVLIRAVHDVELQLLGAQLELQKDAGLQVRCCLWLWMGAAQCMMPCVTCNCLGIFTRRLSFREVPATLNLHRIRAGCMWHMHNTHSCLCQGGCAQPASPQHDV